MKTDTVQVQTSPKVSIVMPCFNSAAHIDATLRSLSEQIFQDYELIVVDDGSTDDTLLRVEQWRAKLPCLKIIKSTKNLGPGDARNKGIDLARAKLIALIDSDDVWFKHKLEMQVAVHAATDCAFSCTAFKFGDTEIYKSKTDYISLLKNNVINTSSVMFDRSKIDLRFQSEYKSEDYVAWLQVSKKTKIKFINTLLVERCQIEGASANKLQMAQRRWEIYRRTEGLGFLSAAYYFCHYTVSGVLKHYRA
ncbi:MAG: teichuronic acid biosynthesis glycosyltransferase TuaG [Porticoccaceae bacterium]|jgi:teichuronic acid biosynthesis glycosyltransferase TuaG